MAEVAHRGADGTLVAFDDDDAKTTRVALDGVREADDAGTDDDEVSGQRRCVVGHDADSTVTTAPNAALV